MGCPVSDSRFFKRNDVNKSENKKLLSFLGLLQVEKFAAGFANVNLSFLIDLP
jgi:hypothetical protein